MLQVKVFDFLKDDDRKNLGDIDNYILNYIESNPDEFVRLTQNEICERIFITQTSLSRFTKKVGFNSFKMLQIHVAKHLEKYLITPELNLHTVVELEDVKRNVFEQYINLVKIVFSSIDDSHLNSLINLINSHKKLVVFGIGSSFETGKYFARQLSKSGIEAIAFNSLHDFVDFYPTAVRNGYHFLIISQKFTNLDCVKVAKILDENKIKFSLISKNQNYNFKSNDRINPVIYNTFKNRVVDFEITDKIAQFMILDIVLFYLLNKNDPQYENINISKNLWKIIS